MSRGPITLITDFGQSDHFVGAMKGVILSIAPKARIVDITHAIPPYDLTEGAFTIAQVWRYFPKRTIHVVVVDPTVGSARRPILVEAGGHYFIAPDNGVLSMIYEEGAHKVRVISNPKVMNREISSTFHGRDVFAPAAAHLASGASPAQFGKRVADYVRTFPIKPARLTDHTWRGKVLKVDHFGNIITNLHIDDFQDVKTTSFELRIGVERIRRLAQHYAEVAQDELCAIVGSSGYIEVATNQASAANSVGCRAGAPVELEIFYD